MALFDSNIIFSPQNDLSAGVPAAYQNLLSSNPYKNLTYRESPWQKVLGWLGFRTQADAWRENMAVQAKEYDASVMEKIQEEQYNDPSAQVARMKQAGLNPDLDPSSIDSGSAAQLGEDPSTPMQSSSDMDQVSMFANGIMQILTTSIGLAGSVQGLERNRIQNSILSVEDDNSMVSLAEQMFGYLLAPESLESPEGSEAEDWQKMAVSWRSNSLGLAQMFARNSLSKKNQKKFLNTIDAMWSGVLGESKSYDEFSKNIKSRFGYQVDKGTYLDEQGLLNDIFAQELGDLAKDIIALRSKYEQSSLEEGIQENEYNEEFYRTLNQNQGGALAADVQLKGDKFQQMNLEMTSLLNERLDNIINRVQKAADEGGFKGGAASFALSLLGVFRLMMVTQGLPSLSHSSNQSIGFGKGVYQSNGESMSLGW